MTAHKPSPASRPASPLEEATAFLDSANAAWVESLYQDYCGGAAGQNLGKDWRALFAKLDGAAARPSWQRADWPPANGSANGSAAADGHAWEEIERRVGARLTQTGAAMDAAAVRAATLDSVRAIMMIRAYRMRGHLAANLDPLQLEPPVPHPELVPDHYGFHERDWDRPIFIDNVLGLESASIREMLELLRRTYCGTFAVEFMHISSPEEKAWLQERIEGPNKSVRFTPEGKRAIFHKLVETEGLEKFLHLKYTGTKRFGLDGGEAMTPALEQIIKRGGACGVKEILIGMPHRGRLNVLTNVMGKPFRALFQEFRGGPQEIDAAQDEGSGDVKYHLGASSDRDFDGNRVHLSLSSNPSHLEAVDPVVLGAARARQDSYGANRASVIPLLLHGDAAFAGQGIVAECLGLSGLKGHRTAGSIHFIVNNQIGFTTNPRFSRSSPYPSDVAKMVEAPIFHVNGDDPEAVVHAAKIATEFRQKFLKPVVIDMFCYRRFGHNEGDEPSFTQPLMYARIKKHPTTLTLYGARLAEEGIVSEAEIKEARDAYRRMLDEEHQAAADYKRGGADWLSGRWDGIKRKQPYSFVRPSTGVAAARLRKIGAQLTEPPSDEFQLHRGLKRHIAARREMLQSGRKIDWAFAEALALGSLLQEGVSVRLSGQDSERGTFSQRHGVWFDQTTEARYVPLESLATDKSRFELINSMLSEAAVLGFEYGYSQSAPHCLTLWEAQYGDFANGAQVIVDQFISSAESKWHRMSGLVMLLPHGYEGQGPEHSSARLERYLQLCAEDNMQIVNCTTPANYFHVLRRQLHRQFRKPLLVMTPKSLLRHKLCVSEWEDFSPRTSFHRLLWDHEDKRRGGALPAPKEVKRVILCSGKIYYDLFAARAEANCRDVYLMRLEQLHPFPGEAVMKELKAFAHAEMVWCQEEPRNMGAYAWIAPWLAKSLREMHAKQQQVYYAGRRAAASPATGQLRRHEYEQAQLIQQALFGRWDSESFAPLPRPAARKVGGAASAGAEPALPMSARAE